MTEHPSAQDHIATIIFFLLEDSAFMHACMSPGLCPLPIVFGTAQTYSNCIMIRFQCGIITSKIDVHSSRCLVPKRLGVQGWEKVCSTKKMNRFHPPEVKQGLQQLEIAKEHLQAAALTAWEAFLGEFALHYAPFRGAVMALASLDALHSLATLACNTG
jgi:hypothetical protein